MVWYPNAVIRPGPDWKRNQSPLWPQGVVCHSAVGFIGGLHDVLDSQTPSSWHFSILFDGTVEQHYDTSVQCWHAQAANAFAVGIEHEGGYDPENEPLTPAQKAASIALVRWLGEQHNFVLERGEPGRTLFEHNQFYPKPCPSNRIPWEEYVMVSAEKPRKLDVASPEDADLRAMIQALANNRITPLRFDADGRAVYEMSIQLPA